MSGPICPDCDSFDIEQVEGEARKDRCTFCGWEGDPLPRKIMSSGMYVERAERMRRKKQLREAGRLAFVRVYLKDALEDYDDLQFELMDLLDIHSMGGATGEPRYFFLEYEGRPSEDLLDAIKRLDGVEKITVH